MMLGSSGLLQRNQRFNLMEPGYFISPTQIFLALYDAHLTVKESQEVARDGVFF